LLKSISAFAFRLADVIVAVSNRVEDMLFELDAVPPLLI